MPDSRDAVMSSARSHRAGVGLVIGVGEYQHLDPRWRLPCAAQDARAVANILTDPDICAFPPDKVIALTNEEAGRDALKTRLSKWLPENARGADIVVIFFAGHGVVDIYGDEEEGFLLPYDGDVDNLATCG